MLGLQQLCRSAVLLPSNIVMHLDDEPGIWTIRAVAQHLKQAPPRLVLVARGTGRRRVRSGHVCLPGASASDRPRRFHLPWLTLPTLVPEAVVHNPRGE